MQEISFLKKEVDRWKEEVKIQEGKSATSAGRLKEEVDSAKRLNLTFSVGMVDIDYFKKLSA